MLTEEDVESWNQLFPDCQINNINLGNPTEGFLINALICYLRRFGFKVEPPFGLNIDAIENNKETRSFLIKLTRQIDHFLKITDKSYTFTYYDLIKPTPKKTVHMLYILLNYYYYYNLYKEDVFKMAGEKIRKLEELKDYINKTRCDNEHRREDNVNMKSTVENLMVDVPTARTKLNELDKKCSEQEDEYGKIKNSLLELEEKLTHLEEQKKVLRRRIVLPEEFLELQNQIHKFKIDLADQMRLEQSNDSNLSECKESIGRLQNLSNEIQICHELVPLACIKELKATNDDLNQIKKEEHDLYFKYKNVIKEIEKENGKTFSTEKDQQIKILDLQTQQPYLTTALIEKENLLKQKNAQLLQLEKQYHICDCRLEEQKDIAQYLLENISEILSGCDN